MTRTLGGRLLGPFSIVAATAALIALTWISTLRPRARTRRGRGAGQANVANQAQVFEDQLQRKLLEVDQALRILAPFVGVRPEASSICTPGAASWFC